jgi:hypothetical protein
MMMLTEYVDDSVWQRILIDEPAAPSLPGVYRQPILHRLTKTRVQITPLLRDWAHAYIRRNASTLHAAQQQLNAAFAPLLQWAITCWDFLLTAEGCRFLARTPGEKTSVRGDYRVCTIADYHRLVAHTFRQSLAHFVEQDDYQSLEVFLQSTFWPAIQARYDALRHPVDVRQRCLTPYSYLRCTPYQFLNAHHQVRVMDAVRRLPAAERHIVQSYFLQFYTIQSIAAAQDMSLRRIGMLRRRAVHRLASLDTLSAALLLQIERY